MGMNERKLLEKLLEKLKGVGDLRSIYLNALIGRSVSKLDLYVLKEIKDGLPEAFLENLFTKESFEQVIEINKKHIDSKIDDDDEAQRKKKELIDITKRILDIYRQTHDNFLEFGTQVFGLVIPC